MNKWRLLLFSVFGLLQITTSDRNFIDGRDRCCHHSLPSSISDTRISIYEPFRVSTLLPKLRQIKSPEISRREQDLEQRRSSYRPHIIYREEHSRNSASRRDDNRRAIDNQRIRENEVQDILRARTNRQKISTIAFRDSSRQDESRIERFGNRYVRSYARETVQRNAREDFNIRRESFERKRELPTRFTDRDTMSTDTNRNNRQNARQIKFVRDAHEDLDRRVQYIARREVSDETRNAVNNLEERVSRLTKRNSLRDEPSQTEEFRSRFRATRVYDNMPTRNDVRIERDNRNRERSLNVNLRALQERNTQIERIGRLIKRSVSVEMVRDESSTMNNREDRDVRRQRSSRVLETNQHIRLSRQNDERNIDKYSDSRSNKGDFSRLTSNNLNIRSNNDENLFERDMMMRVNDQKLRYTLRNDNNNRDNKRQVLRETIGQRNNIVQHINLNRRDASNIIERHIQSDVSRLNIRDSRDVRCERSTEERTVRNDNEQRRGSIRAQAMDEIRIRSNNRENIYRNQGDNINEEVQRSRSERLINSRRTERSMRQTVKHTSLDRNNVNDVAQVLQRRRERSMQKRLAIKLDNRDVRRCTEYERKSRSSQDRYRNVLQDFRSNSDEETQRISPQRLEVRNLAQQSIRRTNVQNIGDTSDVHRIRSRSLEEKFSSTLERDQIRNRDIKDNEILRERFILRHVQKQSTKRQATDESRFRSSSLPMSDDVQNFRFNIAEEIRRMKSQDMRERINGQRVSDFRSDNVDIRDEVLTSLRFRVMQERLSINRNRQETGNHMNNARQQRPRTMDERRRSKSQNMIVLVRTVDEEARRIRSRNQETVLRQVMDKSIRISNVRNNRNIDVDSKRMRSRNVHERINKDESRIIVDRSASRSSEIRTIRNNQDRQNKPATERVTDIRLENIPEKRQFDEHTQRTDMRRMITLSRENRSRTIYRDTDNKQSASSMFEVKWQYLFYAMQGIYLCSLFIKISKDEGSKKKPRMNNWLTPVDLKID